MEHNMIEDQEVIASRTPKRQARKKMGPQSEESKRAAAERGTNSIANDIVRQVGVILPNCPTTPQELVNAWGVSPGDVESHSVLIFRQRAGVDERVLIDSVPMLAYSLDEIVSKYGSGTYYLKGSAGRYERKAGKFIVSEEFASSRGYGRLPEAPKAADVQAVRTLQRASEASGVDPVDLASAIQRASEAATRQILESYGITGRNAPNPAMVGNGFGQMESQFQQVEKMYGFMERMEARAMESVERRMGIAPSSKADDPDPNSWAGILSALAPIGVKVAEALMSRSMPVIQEHPVMPTKIQPEQPTEEPVRLNIPQEYIDTISPAIRMLKPFKSMLFQVDDGAKSASAISMDLSAYIPPGCYDAMMSLGKLVSTHGPQVLSLIGPEFANERWGSIVIEIGKEIEHATSEVPNA
jgi:hypothetical protein